MPEQKFVLIVDDDAEVRGLLHALLTRQGLTVDVAGDGATALDLIGKRNYSVVLLDLVMPDVDGFAVMESIKRPGGSAPVVLVVTGADRSVVDRLDARHIHGIVRKPFEPDDLVTLVVACADIKSRGTFGTMAIATMIAGSSHLLDWLNRFAR
jgi:DNA-binding response OmpR family regulator